MRKHLADSEKSTNFVPLSKTTGRDAGVVDRGGLENRCAFQAPRVRIPVSPQTKRLKLAEFQRVSFVLRGSKIWLVPQISPP